MVDNPQFAQAGDDIVKMFDAMGIVVCEQLQKLIDAAAEQPEEKGIEYGDVFTDFTTDDYISKNIRVRPISGFTHADETKDGRASNFSKGNVPTEGEEGEDNYNKFAILELEDQRKAIKVQQREKLEEAKRKKALEEKAAELRKGK